MALGLRRTGFVLLTLAAVLLPLRHRSVPEVGGGEDHQARRRAIVDQLGSVVYRWTAEEQRDSALALIGTRGPLPGIALSGFAAGARPLDRELDQVSGLWERIGARDSTVRIAVLAYDPDRYEHRSGWGLYQGNLIVRRDRLLWCIAILSAYPDQQGRGQIGRHRLSWGTAPCAFLAAFGSPGTEVARWLDDLGFAPARVSPWDGPWEASGDEDPWSYLPDPSFLWFRDPPGFRLTEALGAERIAELLAPPYRFGAPGLRCITGHSPSCSEAVLQPGLAARRERWPLPDLTGNLSRFPGVEINLATPRPPGPSFLADLYHRHGRDRFRTFWTSDRPVAEAFADAFGEPLGDWTARWAREQWLSTWEARYRSPDITLGVTLGASWPLHALAWGLASLLIASIVARRRQVT